MLQNWAWTIISAWDQLITGAEYGKTKSDCIYSLYAITSQISPCLNPSGGKSSGMQTLQTDTFRLQCFQTPTGEESRMDSPYLVDFDFPYWLNFRHQVLHNSRAHSTESGRSTEHDLRTLQWLCVQSNTGSISSAYFVHRILSLNWSSLFVVSSSTFIWRNYWLYHRKNQVQRVQQQDRIDRESCEYLFGLYK